MIPRILVADDCPDIRGVIAATLDSCGYLVTIANDGLAAWEAIGRDQPSLVVLDIDMPLLDGCEVCRRIKSQPETSGIPVLLVSAGGQAAERARGAGADAFLDKPFRLRDLLGQVNLLLSRSAAAANRWKNL
jgi:DNA-binding response OmpR family regulator